VRRQKLFYLMDEQLINDLAAHFELLEAGGEQTPEIQENLLARLLKCQFVRADDPRPDDPEQPF
jgi:hypothetical protein